jgi:DNA helicase HerA-like ATPase
MVFDFSETEDRDLVRFAAELLARLYTLQNVRRRPLLIFFEEMAEYAPLRTTGRTVEPWVYDRMKSRIVKIATQGRPLGFNLAFTSQRPAQLDFTVRMMANLSLYGKFHPRDLSDLREVLKSYDAPVKPEQCVNMPKGCWLAS